MAPKPHKVEDEPGAEERFERGIRNALATPPKPHKPKAGTGEPAPRPVSGQK